ncbi:uncharacterized protein LOC135218019 [Macrobrachium nipponense]|uniref:uncharacterized protein LOC135218019 n=1 Tax=Macrobrachium nipponense TaxID=159736 RepID=UPI0030C81CFE
MEAHIKKIIVVLLVTFSSATYDFVMKPEFIEKSQDLNVTSYVGQTSRLPCTVKYLSGKRVSWIRQRDLQVLSTGRHTFSTDLRISVLPGIRFKLRRSRDLVLQRPFFRRVSRGTRWSGEGFTSRTWNIKPLKFSTVYYDYRQAELQGENKNVLSRDVTFHRKLPQGSSESIEANLRNKLCHQHFRGSKENIEKKIGQELRPPYFIGSNENNRRTVIDLYNHERKNNPTYKNDTGKLLSHKSSWVRRRKKRSKKATTSQIHEAQIKEESQTMILETTTDQSPDKSHSQTSEKGPIAIFPQGPVPTAREYKHRKLTPNYIDGAWEPEDYSLQIKDTKPEDAGTYICQINTEPRISQSVVLTVVRMSAEILGSRELFVKAGNPVTLSCRVNRGALSPAELFLPTCSWHFHSRPLPIHTARIVQEWFQGREDLQLLDWPSLLVQGTCGRRILCAIEIRSSGCSECREENAHRKGIKKIRKLTSTGMKAKFMWVPFQVKMPGNERAYELAIQKLLLKTLLAANRSKQGSGVRRCLTPSDRGRWSRNQAKQIGPDDET